MLDKMHDHITSELKTNSVIDIILVLTAIILNLLILAINSIIASEGSANYLIMLLMVVLAAIVSITVEVGMIKGRNTKTKLINGLLEMYKDNNIDKYYDASLIKNYRIRYTLFMIAVLATGFVAIVVPLIVLFE